METYIAREDDYRNEIRNHFNSILKGRLLSFDLKRASDEDISKFLIDFDGKLSFTDNSCTWLEIGKIVDSEYNGKPFSFVELLDGKKNALKINFSQFTYGMNKKDQTEGFCSYDPNKPSYVSLVDGSTINPSLFFLENKGRKLLYLNSFLALTAFNSVKRCYRFAFKHIELSNIRDHIYNCQESIIKDLLDNPTRDIPGTTIKIEFGGNAKPMYHHNVTGKETHDFALNIFNKEFKDAFINKLSDLEKLKYNQ